MHLIVDVNRGPLVCPEMTRNELMAPGRLLIGGPVGIGFHATPMYWGFIYLNASE